MDSSHTPAASGTSDAACSGRSFDLYAEITRQITAMLEKGVVPWRSPILGQSQGGFPRNFHSKKPYRGVNVFLLSIVSYLKGFSSAYWLTFRQAKEAGGSIKKGEHSSLVVFWKKTQIEDTQTHEKKNVFVARYYRVFSVDQCNGIAAPDAAPVTPTDYTPIDAAEKIVKGYADGPAIKHGGQQAYYRPSTDTVKIPEPTRFSSTELYFGTLLHELSHSTGARKRLDRGLEAKLMPFGSPDYGKEELIAEMSAAFLCGHAGIAPAVIENQAAYVSSWLGRIKQDKKLIIQAAAAGQRAADWILGQRYVDASEPAVPPETGAAEVAQP